jgi:excisionase family DNA binding protein
VSEKILSTRTVATALDVSERTIRNLCELGAISHYRVGRLYRIKQSDLDSYLAKRYVCDSSERTESAPKAY